MESGGGDLQTIQIDDYVDLDSSLHQESNVDPEKTDDDDDEKATSVENDDDDDDNNVNDRSTETITANDFVIERPCEPEPDLEVEPEPRKEPEVVLLTTPEDTERTIAQLLTESKFVDAVQTYRKLKTRWPDAASDSVVGVPSVADDVWALLNMYCSQSAQPSAPFFALTVPDSVLADHCDQLMTASMQVNSQPS